MKSFRTTVFIFIVISTTICPLALFMCLSNSGTYMELRTTSFIESTAVAYSDSVSYNWVRRPPEFIKGRSSKFHVCSPVRQTPEEGRNESRGSPDSVIANGISTGVPRGFNKGRSSKFYVGSRVRQTPEEGRRAYLPKRCGNNNKDEDNSPKTFNDKNHQVSPQKFRQVWLVSSFCNCHNISAESEYVKTDKGPLQGQFTLGRISYDMKYFLNMDNGIKTIFSCGLNKMIQFEILWRLLTHTDIIKRPVGITAKTLWLQ